MQVAPPRNEPRTLGDAEKVTTPVGAMGDCDAVSVNGMVQVVEFPGSSNGGVQANAAEDPRRLKKN